MESWTIISAMASEYPGNAAHIVRNGLEAGVGTAIWSKSVLGDPTASIFVFSLKMR